MERVADPGMVYLVGAGPGDPDLMTVKGARILKKADVIVYDRLANPELLALTKKQSEHIYVGKRPSQPSVSQDQINQILVAKGREGKLVARLKGGDPFVFGRGGEECEALKEEEIPYEVVPGISSALAAPAYAGIPVTQRKVARSFTVVTGHTIKNEEDFTHWQHLIYADTLVILMGMRSLPEISNLLITRGRSSATPVCVIESATYQSQKTVFGTLASIVGKAESLSSPGTIVVGELASKSESLAWFRSESSVNNTMVENTQKKINYIG